MPVFTINSTLYAIYILYVLGFKGPQHPVNVWDVLRDQLIGELVKE